MLGNKLCAVVVCVVGYGAIVGIEFVLWMLLPMLGCSLVYRAVWMSLMNGVLWWSVVGYVKDCE